MRLNFVALPLVLAAQTVYAADPQTLQDVFVPSIRTLASDPVLVQAIQGANAATGSYDQAMIATLDATWQAEVGKAQTPTITPVVQSAAADFLRAEVAKSGGTITEIILMDAIGLNVATTDTTSDMWQGDEDKFAKTYPMGPDAVFIDEVEFDESTQTFQRQISISVVDPATNAVIGAMTVAVDAEAVF